MENNTLWTLKTQTNKEARAGSVWNESTLDCLSASNCIGLYITIKLLTSPSKINIWPKTDELFSFLLFGWRFSYDFLSFVTLRVKTHKTSQMIDRKIRNYLDRVRKSIKNKNSKICWNLMLWTTSLPSTWPKVFSQKLIWSGEIYYTNIVVLDLFWRWEVKIRFLRNNAFHCVFIRLHGNTFSNLKTRNLSKQTTRQPSISFVIEDHRQIIVTTNDSENRLSLYADWLRSINHTIWYRGYHV